MEKEEQVCSEIHINRRSLGMRSGHVWESEFSLTGENVVMIEDGKEIPKDKVSRSSCLLHIHTASFLEQINSTLLMTLLSCFLRTRVIWKMPLFTAAQFREGKIPVTTVSAGLFLFSYSSTVIVSMFFFFLQCLYSNTNKSERTLKGIFYCCKVCNNKIIHFNT